MTRKSGFMNNNDGWNQDQFDLQFQNTIQNMLLQHQEQENMKEQMRNLPLREKIRLNRLKRQQLDQENPQITRPLMTTSKDWGVTLLVVVGVPVAALVTLAVVAVALALALFLGVILWAVLSVVVVITT